MKKQLSLALLSVLLLASSVSLQGAKNTPPAPEAPVEVPATSGGVVAAFKSAVTSAISTVKANKKVAVAVAVAAVATGAVVVAYKKSSWFRELLGVEDKKEQTRFVY